MPEKPNSKRGQVRTRFREQGEEAALTFGQEQGVKSARLKRWIKMWVDKPATPTRGEPPLKAKARSRKILAGKKRIYLFDDLTKTATMSEEGPEQSVVIFDNGSERVVSNNWWKPLPEQEEL